MRAVPHVRQRVAKRVKQLRLQRGWSQEQLAERVGTSAKHISSIERAGTNIGLDGLAAIADELGVDVADLIRNYSGGGSTIVSFARHDLERVEEVMEEALRIVARAKSGRAKRAE